jgi:hypothetical protein
MKLGAAWRPYDNITDSLKLLKLVECGSLRVKKIRNQYSFEYTNIPKVFFLSHHIGCCLRSLLHLRLYLQQYDPRLLLHNIGNPQIPLLCNNGFCNGAGPGVTMKIPTAVPTGYGAAVLMPVAPLSAFAVAQGWAQSDHCPH